jgi:hypothetical protein
MGRKTRDQAMTFGMGVCPMPMVISYLDMEPKSQGSVDSRLQIIGAGILLLIFITVLWG